MSWVGSVAVAITFLVNLDRVNNPISLSKGLGITRHILLAGWGQSRAFRIRAPDLGASCPGSAKGGVKDNLVVLEMVVNVTGIPAQEPSKWSSPRAGIGLPRLNILGDLGSRKEPDGNVIRSPFSGINTTSNGVEPVAIVLGIGGVLSTTG